jgi:glucoamylase
MTTLHDARRAFGGPGIEPRWTQGAKDAIGTAYSASSAVWFTVSAGILNEVYYPTIDRPQIRDLQYLVTDGTTFFHDERRHVDSRVEYLDEHGLGVRVTNTEREGRYRIVKEVITDPHQACVLIRTRLSAEPGLFPKLRLFALLAPHLEVGGWGNSGYAAEVLGREILTAQKGETQLALAATIPFLRRSCGYVGTTDGWTDLADNFQMDWEFDTAEDGNIALVGELDLSRGREFTLGLAFGDSLHNAVTTLFQSLGFPFAEHRERFSEQWRRACHRIAPLEKAAWGATTSCGRGTW